MQIYKHKIFNFMPCKKNEKEKYEEINFAATGEVRMRRKAER